MSKRRRQLLTCHDATPTKRQHRVPCSDCPWARTALPGWLAQMSTEQWLRVVHGDGRMECHTRTNAADGTAWHCAGAAIFRANVCKVPRDDSLLRLPADRVRVFATNAEFSAHHSGD